MIESSQTGWLLRFVHVTKNQMTGEIDTGTGMDLGGVSVPLIKGCNLMLQGQALRVVTIREVDFDNKSVTILVDDRDVNI